MIGRVTEETLEKSIWKDISYSKLLCRLFELETQIENNRYVWITTKVGTKFYSVVENGDHIEEWEVVGVEIVKDDKQILHCLVDGKSKKTINAEATMWCAPQWCTVGKRHFFNHRPPDEAIGWYSGLDKLKYKKRRDK